MTTPPVLSILDGRSRLRPTRKDLRRLLSRTGRRTVLTERLRMHSERLASSVVNSSGPYGVGQDAQWHWLAVFALLLVVVGRLWARWWASLQDEA